MNRRQRVSHYLELQRQLIEAYTSYSEKDSVWRLTDELAAAVNEIRRLPLNCDAVHESGGFDGETTD